MRFLGVDPGFSGALALYDDELGTLEVCDMPCRDLNTKATVKQEVDEDKLHAWLEDHSPIDLACVEKVASRPGQGVATMYAFGEATGVVVGAIARSAPVIRMTPKKWQQIVQLRGGEHIKDHSRDKAVLLFPAYAALFGRKKDSGRSDATLIAYAISL